MINNLTHITNMRLEIPDANHTMNFVNSSQSVTIPSVEMEVANVSINQMTSGKLPGSKMIFEPVRVRFVIDEYFKSYAEIYQWMISITDARGMKSTAHISGNSPRTMLVHILDNSKRNIVLTFKYYDPFPSSIDEVEMSYGEDGNPVITGMVTFNYSSMVVVVGGNEVLPRQTPTGSPSFHPFS